MTKLAEKKRPTEVAALTILNIGVGVLYLVICLCYDSIFYTELGLIGATFIRGILGLAGIVFFVLAYGLWNGNEWAYLSLLGLASLFLYTMGSLGEGVGAKVLNPPFVYCFLAELFGLVYILFVGIFIFCKSNVETFIFKKTKP